MPEGAGPSGQAGAEFSSFHPKKQRKEVTAGSSSTSATDKATRQSRKHRQKKTYEKIDCSPYVDYDFWSVLRPVSR